MNMQQMMAAIAQLQNQVAQMTSYMTSGGGASPGAGVATMPTSQIVPFDYLTTIVLAGNGNGQTNIQMSSDSTFELQRILGYTSADNPTDVAPNWFSCLLTDQSTGRALASAPIPQCMLVTRSYQYGNDEKYPILFPAQGIVQCAFTNLNALQITITLVLKGYKIYQTSPSG